MNALISRLSSAIPPLLARSAAAEPAVPAGAIPAVIEEIGLGVLIADLRLPEMPLSYVNRGFETITGYSREEAIGKNCRYLQGADRLQPEIGKMHDAILAREPLSVTLRNYRKDGACFINELKLLPIVDGAGEATHYVGLMHDVTEKNRIMEALGRAADLDQLTGILNRYAFVERFEAILSAQPDAQPMVAKIDVAHFHAINAGYGYDLGDALLKEIARRLTHIGARLVARVGGDQFAILCLRDQHNGADQWLLKIQQALGRQYRLEGAAIDVRFAIGFAVGGSDANALSLVRQAGTALHQSKITRWREVQEFDRRDDAQTRNRLRMTSELQQAVVNGEFRFQYQPKIDLGSGALVGAEALLRWDHGVFGLQSPSRFIPLAEDTGLILDIGHWGRQEVARFAAEVNRGRSTPLRFAVNVSAVELAHRDLTASMAAALETSGADPAWLTLELTESLMAEGTPELIALFKQLRALGVGLSVDDFGTGYSSLRYIERFPLSEIKIDGSFVNNLALSATKRIIVNAVIDLGLELGLDIVAEGIETDAERLLLQTMNCRYGQGFLFDRPLDAEKFKALAAGAG